MSFGGIFHDSISGTWDEAKGYIKEELEQMRTALNNMPSVSAFDNDSDETTLESFAISGNAKPATRYVANTGTNNKPTWDRVNLQNGVKGILAFTFLPSIAAGSLLGRRSGSSGVLEAITPGTTLAISGTTLDVVNTPTRFAKHFLLLS
jgi:hypothetical protein